MRSLDLDAVTAQPYGEFLRVGSLSAGVYELAAGAQDGQSPHTEDELYVVLSGSATLVAGDERVEVRPGSAVFVDAGVPHRFVDIVRPLRVLVVFAPAEGTLAR
jgi:mannose-6-phosphate isomerase-like protein (cupin superfamily)